MGTAKVTKVRMNPAGVVAILKSGGVQSELTGRAQAIADSLPTGNGEEWAVNAFTGRDRAQAVVKTANHAARKTAAEDNSLLLALAAGRG